MAVIIDAIGVVIRNATIEKRLPGGMEQHIECLPATPFYTDGEICCVGLMDSQDVNQYLAMLVAQGFILSDESASSEVAVVDWNGQVPHPCDWLEICQVDLDEQGSVTVASIRGTTQERLVAPPGWEPGRTRWLSRAELKMNYDYMGNEGRVEAYRHKATGDIVRVPRMHAEVALSNVSPSSILQRSQALWKRAGDWNALDDWPGRASDLEVLREEARELVRESAGLEPMPLMIVGVVSRLLRDWEEAVRSFQGVTALAPDDLDGWLELTVALAKTWQVEGAEIAARKAAEMAPDDARTLANLADVLLRRGKLGEAKQAADAAFSIDPTNINLSYVVDEIDRQVKAADPRRHSWWRRLLGIADL